MLLRLLEVTLACWLSPDLIIVGFLFDGALSSGIAICCGIGVSVSVRFGARFENILKNLEESEETWSMICLKKESSVCA